ncbi:MAG TPA: 50S ribosomal protein L11 methyltransferase [Bacteroides sp.]|nr:50S ribosomal protein L11 methyltransferase [Bacteroides sp.]
MPVLEFEIPARSMTITQREILVAKMSLIGFDGFVESGSLIKAYMPSENYSGEEMNRLIDECVDLGIRVQYRFHETEEQNWNREWEKKFHPVVIGDQLLIRAPFHGNGGDLPCTIVIEPKMSFGTGHHHTTRLMLLEMMQHDMEGKRVLDVGCGTAILGIYAQMRGARRVLGIDNDQWAYENALENVKQNRAGRMEIRLGDIGSAGDEKFDFLLANITRNTLVQEMSEYCGHLADRGVMILSGFLDEDVQFVLNAAYRCGMDHLRTREDSSWILLSFVR